MSRVVIIDLSLIVGYTCMQDDVNTSMARGVLYLDACTHISKVHQVLKDELFVINREVVVN